MLALIVLYLGSGLPGVFLAHALAGVLALVFAHLFYRRLTVNPLRYSPKVARELLVGGSVIMTAILATNIQPYIDAVILSKLAPSDVIGWYGAAKNILGTLVAPALILGTASFPRLVRAAQGAQFKAEVQTAMRPILWLGALATSGTILFADDAIAIVYGKQQFGPAAIIMKVFATGCIMIFSNILLGGAFVAIGRARSFSVLKVASVVFCSALELVLIPLFQQRSGNGGIGAVAAFVASEFVVLGGGIALLWRAGIALGISGDMARAIGSTVLTLLFFWRLPPLPFLLGVPLCVIVFVLCSAGLRLVRRTDLKSFQALLRKEEAAPSLDLSSRSSTG